MTAPKVAICVPAGDTVQTAFANDLAGLMAWTTRNLTANGHLDEVRLLMASGSLIHEARQSLAEEAFRLGADAILWLDSDMRFPPDTLHRLLSRKEDLVGVNYTTRAEPPNLTPTARNADGELVWPDGSEPEVQEVGSIGLGIALTTARVFNALPWPWFELSHDTEAREYEGEDVILCQKHRARGGKVFVDNTLAEEVAHVGTFSYRTQHLSAVDRDDDPES